jgi:osmoprotectant transport system permease protein
VTFLADVVDWFTDGAHWRGPDGIPTLTRNHLQVSFAALAVAAAIAAPIGTVLGHRGRGGVVAINLANLFRAVPTYALLVLAVQLTGISAPSGFGWTGSFQAFLALGALGIPPILANSYLSIREVGPELTDAARGMGMRERDVLWRVELPNAIALQLTGLRTAMVAIVATATLASFTGYPTLALPIARGLAVGDDVRVFAGATLVALLAVAVDGLLAAAGRRVIPKPLRHRPARLARAA